MPIAHENIDELREAIKKIDHSVYKLTNIFFVDYKTKNVKPEMLSKIQQYIVQMSMLIPEIMAYLDLIDVGLFDNVEFIMNRFKLMDEYIRITEKSCEDLLKDLELV